MKNKKRRFWFCLGLVLAGCLFYDFCQVSGKELWNLVPQGTKSTVTITQYPFLAWDAREEVVLDEAQVEALETLFLESDFTKTMTDLVWIKEQRPQVYDILWMPLDGSEPLSIHCIGNDHLLVTNHLGGKHLEIKNEEWEETLSEIFSQQEIEP